MRNLTVFDSTKTQWVQVQKRTAKKLFDQGQELVFCPCKMYPFGFWNCGIKIAKTEQNESFERICSGFEYYNCTSETGNYITFYTKFKPVS